MQRWTLAISCLFLASASIAPVAAGAADGVVGGKGPRIHVHGHRPVSAEGRPVFVTVDELARFGDWHLDSAPALVIRVEGDVAITQLPDGRLRFELGAEDE